MADSDPQPSPDPASSAFGAFATRAGSVRVERLGSGHIHESFLAEVDAASPRYVLQRLHAGVFPDPERLMRNLVRVTAHLAAKLARAGVADRERRVLALVPTRDGLPFHRDASGACWRCFHFVEDSVAVDAAPTRAQAFAAARAFGAFAAAMADLAPPPLEEVIPGFHDLPGRMAALEAVLRDDPCGRARAVAGEAEHARASAERIERRLARAGAASLPRRVVHNDCKVNNVLLDARTGEALCVIDLDTVMEGSVLADFGDLARTAACPAPEDARDLERVRLDLERFEALARGYLEGAGPILTPAERGALPLAGPLLALENAVRFLADHAAGDRYFRIHRAGHNLDRARAQLRLAERMLEAEAEVTAIVRSIGQPERERGRW
jgi:Ser/Thr protein kinase RdoA (MazF antagonist)